jgi:hypothetical protein
MGGAKYGGRSTETVLLGAPPRAAAGVYRGLALDQAGWVTHTDQPRCLT